MQQRDSSAYLSDILDAAAAIQDVAASIDEAGYTATRLIRSAVEREFTIIGEALRVIAQRDPELFAGIPEGSQIIDFWNLLTHEYRKVSDRVVWGAIQTDLPELIEHCTQLLDRITPKPYRGANPVLLTLGMHLRGSALPYCRSA